MARKSDAVVAAANAECAAFIDRTMPSGGRRRNNAERIVEVCRDLVTAEPARDPVSPTVTELGRARFGKRFPTPQTLLNHYGTLLRIWRAAFQAIIDASAPKANRHIGTAIMDEDLEKLDAGSKTCVQWMMATLRESKLENDRMKKLIRDAIPAPGRGGASPGPAETKELEPLRAWLCSVREGRTGFDVEPVGLVLTRRARPGALMMSADAFECLLGLFGVDSTVDSA